MHICWLDGYNVEIAMWICYGSKLKVEDEDSRKKNIYDLLAV